MLALRLQVDSLSLRVDRGEMSLGEAKSLLRYSGREVVRGSPHLSSAVDGLLDALTAKFDEAEYSP